MTTALQQKFTGMFMTDPAHSSFQFAVRHMKVAIFRAAFDDATATIVADDAGIRAEGTAAVESVSIRKPAEFREHVVYGPDFFDAKNHPTIAFRTSQVILNDDGTCAADADLTIKGITKPVSATGTYSLPVADPFGAVRAGVELTARVDRRDWGMNWQLALPGGGDALGYDVDITIALDLIRQA